MTNRGAKDTLEQAFSNDSKDLRKANRIGTAVAYECAQSSLKKFSPEARFADVTPDFLRKYEIWITERGNQHYYKKHLLTYAPSSLQQLIK